MVATRSIIATLSMFPASIATQNISKHFLSFGFVGACMNRFLHQGTLSAKPKSMGKIAKREWFRELFEDRGERGAD